MNSGEVGSERPREMMVASQISARGITDDRVLDAMRKVPREEFVEPGDRRLAFSDGPLSIGYGQTISQPYIVAYMTEELRLKECDRVLEIGTGSGYQTAVLAEIAAEVYTVEIIEPLAQRARKVLERLGYGNIKYRVGDGAAGWPEHAPFDAIMVTAAPEKALHGLMKQLADGGRMIAPVGGFIQNLHLTTRDDDSFDDKRLISVRFVPLTGEAAEGRS